MTSAGASCTTRSPGNVRVSAPNADSPLRARSETARMKRRTFLGALGASLAGCATGTGLVVDLRAMSNVTTAAGKAIVGAGAQLIDVYDQLATQGRGIGAGSCPTVGVSGLTLGGGLGVLTRAWGLTCDQLTAARVVLADGTVVTC